MNQIQRIIKEEIVDPRIMQGAISTYGHILDIDKLNNTATVSILDKQISKYVVYKDVPLPDISNGVISTSIEIRDTVWIEYIGGNKNVPKVSSLKSKWEPVAGGATESTASDNGQGIPDVIGVFGKLGSTIIDMISRM
jgi:hypothetical protein